MKKNKFITLILVFTINFIFSQNDYTVLNIYRIKKFTNSFITADIYSNDNKVFELKNGGHLEFKLFDIKPFTLSIKSNAGTSSLQLNLQKGNIYYFVIKPKFGGLFTLEQINHPVNPERIKEKRFYTISDILFETKKVFSSLPDTEWTKEKLKKYWKDNGSKDIEGIYEKIGTSLEYELAVLKENNQYKIIYLDGAKGTSWQEGDIKATLQKTAQFGIFKANWFMLDKSFNNDIITTFENATMSCILENGRDKDVYLKTYPTYDEGNSFGETEWKSTGTGFFIDKNGYLVTNYHVVEEGNTFEVNVSKNGETVNYNAEIISVDRQNDLAILKINDVKFLPLSNLNYNFETKIEDVGSSVFALGYPLTQIMGEEIKFTDGKISSKSGYKGDITTYQISVPIQSGNSGGPLFDEKGNLVGITSSGINKKLDLAENANYAIKTSYLKLLIESIDEKLELPNSNIMEKLSVTEQIKTISEYVVLIKVK